MSVTRWRVFDGPIRWPDWNGPSGHAHWPGAPARRCRSALHTRPRQRRHPGREAPTDRARCGKDTAEGILRGPAPREGPQAPPQGDLRRAEACGSTKRHRTGLNRQTCAAGSPERRAFADATRTARGTRCGTALRCIGFPPGLRPRAGAEPCLCGTAPHSGPQACARPS